MRATILVQGSISSRDNSITKTILHLSIIYNKMWNKCTFLGSPSILIFYLFVESYDPVSMPEDEDGKGLRQFSSKWRWIWRWIRIARFRGVYGQRVNRVATRPEKLRNVMKFRRTVNSYGFFRNQLDSFWFIPKSIRKKFSISFNANR